jgi:hypothetical protein
MTTIWTAVYFDNGNGAIVACIEELPGTVAIAATIDEARALLAEELRITLEANRWLAWEAFGRARVVCRKELTIECR